MVSGELMNRVENIERYLQAKLASERIPASPDVEVAVMPFVTISRQAGTGGHAVAEAVLETFDRQPDTSVFGGWQVYDKTVCEIVARDPAFARSLDSLIDEEYRSPTSDFFHQMLRSTVDQKMVMNRVFLVVRTIAGMGRAIIVGRGGSHVTRDMDGGVSLRLVASEAFRARRAMEIHGMSEREAIAGARRRDADRARLIRAHFGADIDDPTGYDLVANTEYLSFGEIADAVTAVVRRRAAVTVGHRSGGPRNVSS